MLPSEWVVTKYGKLLHYTGGFKGKQLEVFDDCGEAYDVKLECGRTSKVVLYPAGKRGRMGIRCKTCVKRTGTTKTKGSLSRFI